MTPHQPSQELLFRVAACAGSEPVRWTQATGGHTSAERWIFQLRDDTSVFVKAATDADTERWLRQERDVYERLHGSFLPQFCGWDDTGPRPLLLLEDLSACIWPPPWTTRRIDSVLAALEAVRAATPPPEVRSVTEMREMLASWRHIAVAPQPFLKLGLCALEWLESALPELIAAEDTASLEGTELLHMDVRSDNVCFAGERAILVDWNHASVGEGALDIAGWLPSLQAEGGPPPETLLPGRGDLAALLSGYWASRAGLPPPFPGSRVREVQLFQLRMALPWAVRELGLSAP